ncbi:hypothetical protein GCM10008967_07760 [Bacillus carboniphilus]|uniref:Aspartate phosphatase n=1 Tax=Bacillus carboniphilus TaxID=86663 RepID=A0ABN0VXC2_9BACI
MSKVDEYQEINNLLNEFIQSIHFYEKDEACTFYEHLKDIDTSQLDQATLDKLELYTFRYYTFIHDYSNALEIMNKLHTRYDSMDEEDQILFNTYEGIYKVSHEDIEIGIGIFQKIIDEYDDLPGIVKSDLYYHLCWGYVYLDDYKRSVVFGNKALDLYLGEFNLLRIIYTQMLLAISHLNLGFYNEAEDIYKHLIRNTKILRLNKLLPHIEYNQIAALVKAGNYSKAIKNTQNLLKTLDKDEELYIKTLLSLAEAKIMNRELSDIEELIELVKERSSRKQAFEKYELLSNYYERKLASEYDAYKYLIDKLAPYLLKNKEKKLLLDLTRMMGDYFIKQRNYELASNYYELNLSLN